MVVSNQLIVLFLLSISLIALSDARRGRHRHRNRTRNRIIDGEEVNDGEFPDHIGLAIPTELNMNKVCGGVLLKPNIVLTANHCVKDIPKGKFALALNSEFSPDSWKKEELRKSLRVTHVCPSEAYLHIGYRYSFDFAILRLEGNLENAKTGVISERPLGESERVTAVGFGFTHYDEEHPENNKETVKLRKIKMRPVKCDEYESGDSHICFSSINGGDVCFGDSGSPVYDSDKEIVGITSYGVPGEICRHNFKAKSVFSDAVWYKDNIEGLIEDCEEKPMPVIPPRDDLR